MTPGEIEQYFKDKEDLNTFEYQLVMGAIRFAEQKTIERAREWLKVRLIDNQDNCGYSVVSTFDTTTVEEFICDFEKAVEL